VTLLPSQLEEAKKFKPPFSVELDLREMLPTIRRAFDEKSLQAFTSDGSSGKCLYAGPCAIGVCVPEQYRARLDSLSSNPNPRPASMLSTSIRSLLTFGFIRAPEDQHADLAKLQSAHDTIVRYKKIKASDIENKVSTFERVLLDLEEKYGVSYAPDAA
jgi:hypothetical protein